MKVAFSQVYLHQKATLPFSVHFQRLLTKLVTEQLVPTGDFTSKYGDETDIVFNLSAKLKKTTDIRGPSISKKYKVVEFTVFLPYPVVVESHEPLRLTVELVLDAVLNAASRLDLETTKLNANREVIINEVAKSPNMMNLGHYGEN